MNLKTNEWKPFYLKNLYDIQMGNGFDKNKLDEDTPEVNLVSRVSYNNGVDVKVGFVDNVEPFEAGLVTVALGGSYLGSCFVQEEPFYTGQNVAVMKHKFDGMSHKVNVFISGLVRFECKTKYYAFGRELNTHIRRDFDVKLPVKHNQDGSFFIDVNHTYSEEGYVPDWQFMEDYIKSLHYKPITTKNKSHSINLNVQNWKDFSLISLFDHLESGKISNAGDLEEGNDLPYLGAKKDDNGVMQICTDIPEKRSRGNCVVMICDGQGSVGYANYMNKDFLGTVNLMLGYNDQHLNKYTGLFLATVLSQERPKYSFGRKWKTHIEETVIKLPAILNPQTNKYEPDWQFMEDYIKSLPYGDRL